MVGASKAAAKHPHDPVISDTSTYDTGRKNY